MLRGRSPALLFWGSHVEEPYTLALAVVTQNLIWTKIKVLPNEQTHYLPTHHCTYHYPLLLYLLLRNATKQLATQE